MNALDGLLHGLQAAITPTNLLWLLVGCLLGTLVGILPGLGPPATISILLPIATGFDPATGQLAGSDRAFRNREVETAEAAVADHAESDAAVITICKPGEPRFAQDEQWKLPAWNGVSTLWTLIAFASICPTRAESRRKGKRPETIAAT